MELPADLFRLLVESVQDYAIYLLGQDGTIRSWNAGAQRLKGYTAPEIVGRSFATFFTPEDRHAERPARLLQRALADGRVEDVGWRVRKDGSQFWASAVITTLRDAAGTHIGFAKVTRDLTDRGYRAFVEAAHAIVWTTDASGRPNADSPTWREFTGQSEADWRAQRAYEAVHPDDVGALRDAWTAAMAAASRLEASFRLRRVDGEYVWMHASAIPLLDGDGRVREWFCVTSDISARKHAELETQRALELWHTTLRSIGDAVISTDAAGRVRFMNPIAERLTGWDVPEAAGHDLRAVFPIFNEESGAVVENPVEKVLREGVVVGLANHTVLRQRSGIEIPIDDSAAPIRGADGEIEGVVLVFRDASEEKRAEQRRRFLAVATERLLEARDYRDALARIAELAVPRLADWASVAIADGTEGRTHPAAVAHVDPSKVELARELARRYPPDPGAQRGAPSVIRTGRSELYAEVSSELLEASATDAEHLRILRELDLRSALVVPLPGRTRILGAITLVSARADRLYTEDDLAFAEDLGRRAALIVESRQLEEAAEYANRMKDEFLATMSHELRTPLQAIIGYTSMLRRGMARDTDKALEAIERNAAAQARLVEDILDVSRIVSGKLRLTMARIDIGSAMRAALDSIGPAAHARRIRVVGDLPPDLGEMHGDLERIQQVVWNLVSNAVKFTEPGGTVEVRAARTGSTVQIVVRDTGKGIAREHLSTIFERFRQVDSSTTRQHGGLGLGLAIVRYLVEAHGGTVRAESDGPGTGATFTVTLPAHTDAIARGDQVRDAGPLATRPLEGIRILIVDDDHDARELTSELLGIAGAEVRTAASAHEAFALLQKDPPQLLISDIGMPDEDGYSLLRRVRALPAERGGGVPAIALTAFARPEDVRKAHHAGFQQHIVKPVKPEALLDAVIAWATRR